MASYCRRGLHVRGPKMLIAQGGKDESELCYALHLRVMIPGSELTWGSEAIRSHAWMRLNVEYIAPL